MLPGGEPTSDRLHVRWNLVSSPQERVEQAKEGWKAGRSEQPRGGAPVGREGGAARALIELLVGIAYEPDAPLREAPAVYASEETFALTQVFSPAPDEFAIVEEAEVRE